MSRLLILLVLICCSTVHAACGQTIRGQSALEFQWDHVMPVWIKLNPDFEYSGDVQESYLQLLRPELWKSVQNNEFQRRAAKVEAGQALEKLVADADSNRVFVLKNAHVTLREYDFTLEGFPLTEMGDTYYWYTSSRYSNSNGLPSSFAVFFTNTKPFALLKMRPEVADKFITDRTDRYGNVNRRVFAEVRFQMEGLKEKKSRELIAKIQSVSLYHDANKLKTLAMLQAPIATEENKE